MQTVATQGQASLPGQLVIVTDKGKTSKEQGNLVVKEAMCAMLQAWDAPFRYAARLDVQTLWDPCCDMPLHFAACLDRQKLWSLRCSAPYNKQLYVLAHRSSPFTLTDSHMGTVGVSEHHGLTNSIWGGLIALHRSDWQDTDATLQQR